MDYAAREFGDASLVSNWKLGTDGGGRDEALSEEAVEKIQQRERRKDRCVSKKERKKCEAESRMTLEHILAALGLEITSMLAVGPRTSLNPSLRIRVQSYNLKMVLLFQ